jgi:hypothetical protein
MSKLIGVIAEDKSDVEVLQEIAGKLAARRTFRVKFFVGKGCGKIRSKCQGWARNLNLQHCSSLVIIQDLDFHELPRLVEEIRSALRPSPIAHHIVVIPVREIEAWLLADHDAIAQALSLRKRIAMISNPEAILRPKERLRDLVYYKSEKRKHYVNTIDNRKIAACANLRNLRRCDSFVPLEAFLRTVLR